MIKYYYNIEWFDWSPVVDMDRTQNQIFLSSSVSDVWQSKK